MPRKVNLDEFKKKPKFISVEGPIGVGKTTLTKLLAKKYKFEGHYEDVLKNPYLDDFYDQMERWSFNLQIYFLNSRFRQILDFNKNGKDIIQDRTIYEDAFIFAPNLKAMGLMTNRDFENYKSIFNLMESFVKGPDLLIYLYHKFESRPHIFHLIYLSNLC